MRTAAKPADTRVLRSKNFNNDGKNWRESRMFIYFDGIKYVKSANTIKKQMKIIAEKKIRKLLK